MKAGAELARKFDLAALRFLASVGEPLNPEAVVWGQEAFGLPFHDNWWQTETGGIMIANFAAMDVRPGSMGRPLPGVEAAIVRQTGEDRVEVVEEPDAQGELALRPGWPSMFRGYLGRARALPQVLRRRLVPDRRPRAPRRRRLLLVRRPRRRRHQDVRPPDRPVRGRERADGASGRRRGGRDRQARPGRAGDREGVRLAQGRSGRRAPSCGASCSASRARASARWSRPRRSTSRPRCRRRAAARSCGACSRRASWVCPRATSRRWRRAAR